MSNISCILYPPTLDYNYLVQRPQQLMKSFAELDILSFFLNNPRLPHWTRTGIERLNPKLFLFNQVDPKPFLQEVQPVVYYSATAQVEIIKQYNPALVVFDSVDEPSDEFESWRPYYARAVTSADIVLATSEKLFHMAGRLNPHTYLVPNGCDYNHFSQASSRSLLIPHDMRNLQGPIIGYIGAIATWCDLQLVDRMARKFPDYNFVMVGPLYNVFDVPKRPNIHWLGFKTYEQLPSYAQLFDVGIIPFKLSSMTESVNPIKMWEYMATGMPVVTTALPETRKYRDLLWYAENEEQFMESIIMALHKDSWHQREQRMELAANNSWSARARQIKGLIENRLAEKGIILQPVPEAVTGTMAHQGYSGYKDVAMPGADVLSPFQEVLFSRPSLRLTTSTGNRNRKKVQRDWRAEQINLGQNRVNFGRTGGMKFSTSRNQPLAKTKMEDRGRSLVQDDWRERQINLSENLINVGRTSGWRVITPRSGLAAGVERYE